MRYCSLARVIMAVAAVICLTLRMLDQTGDVIYLKYLLGAFSISIILAVLTLEIVSFKFIYLYLNSATLIELEGIDMDNDFDEEEMLDISSDKMLNLGRDSII